LQLCDDYYVIFEDDKIKHWEILTGLRKLYYNKKYGDIINQLKIDRKKIIINKDDKCCICFTENYNFLSSCKHCYCLECFLMWKIEHNKNECCYCRQYLITKKCCVDI